MNKTINYSFELENLFKNEKSKEPDLEKEIFLTNQLNKVLEMKDLESDILYYLNQFNVKDNLNSNIDSKNNFQFEIKEQLINNIIDEKNFLNNNDLLDSVFISEDYLFNGKIKDNDRTQIKSFLFSLTEYNFRSIINHFFIELSHKIELTRNAVFLSINRHKLIEQKENFNIKINSIELQNKETIEKRATIRRLNYIQMGWFPLYLKLAKGEITFKQLNLDSSSKLSKKIAIEYNEILQLSKNEEDVGKYSDSIRTYITEIKKENNNHSKNLFYKKNDERLKFIIDYCNENEIELSETFTKKLKSLNYELNT